MRGIYVVLVWHEDDFEETAKLMIDLQDRTLTYTYKSCAKRDASLLVKRLNEEEDLQPGEEKPWRFRVIEMNEKGGY